MGIIIFPFDLLEQFYTALRLVSIVSSIALLGVFVISGDLITILISVELFLLSIMVAVIIVAGSIGDPVVGELFILTVLVVGAAETAVALSIVTLFYQGTSVTGVDLVTFMEEGGAGVSKSRGSPTIPSPHPSGVGRGQISEPTDVAGSADKDVKGGYKI